MAYVSHLPQLAVSALMHVVGEGVGSEGLVFAGRGLRDSTRMASSPPESGATSPRQQRRDGRCRRRPHRRAERLKQDLAAGDEPTKIFDSAASWKRGWSGAGVETGRRSDALTATRTYLEMTVPSALRPARAVAPNLSIERVEAPTASLWRYLYTEVGKQHRWFDRLPWTDEEAQAYLDDPAIVLWLATIDAATAGYFELRREADGAVEIVYFGLLPEFTGRGLGGQLLTAAVERAWPPAPRASGCTPAPSIIPRRSPTTSSAGSPSSGSSGTPFADTLAAVTSPLWTPSPERVAGTRMTAFAEAVRGGHGLDVSDYARFYEWSVNHRDAFWRLMWEFGGIRGTMGERTVEHPERLPGARFFPDARLNFADNLLRRRDGATAIAFRGERRPRAQAQFRGTVRIGRRVCRRASAGRHPRRRSCRRLPAEHSRIGGCGARRRGDRRGVVVVLAGLRRAGRARSLRPDRASHPRHRRRLRVRREAPRACRQDRGDRPRAAVGRAGSRRAVCRWRRAGRPGCDADWAEFAPPQADLAAADLPFNHPLYIMYSSGTTGVPKCIVHGAGGTLIQHLKEHQLHSDIRRGDRVFYFTTCGWMMWNWLVSALASEATLVLYDGSPFAAGRAGAVRSRGRGNGDVLRRVGEVHRRAAARRAVAHGDASPRHRADDRVDRLAARARELRFRLRPRQARRAPGVDIGRHRHHRLVRRRQSQRPGLARRAPGAHAGDGGRGVRRAGEAGPRREGGAGLHQCRFRRCRSASGTTPTARSTARRISSATRTSGATATTSS